jgi:hypothetical protein
MKDDTRLLLPEDDLRVEIDDLRDTVLHALRERRIERLREQWEKSGDPLIAWDAIATCTEQKRPLPAWVMDYLADCAQRMTATESSDFRKALPGVMGFAGRQGPRARWDDRDAAERFVFSGLFFYWIVFGDSLGQALDEARPALHPEDAKADDLTLLRWLAKDFGLATVPRTLESWRNAIVSKDVRDSSIP